jgi:multidrug resistance protein MdtO
VVVVPVLFTGAWIAAGSERISYAGVQLMFRFRWHSSNNSPRRMT